jgi:hypothetical protein
LTNSSQLVADLRERRDQIAEAFARIRQEREQ